MQNEQCRSPRRRPFADLTSRPERTGGLHDFPWPAIKQARSITITRSGTESKVDITEVNMALIEKCRDPDRGTTIFFCLGIRADSSWAATEYHS